MSAAITGRHNTDQLNDMPDGRLAAPSADRNAGPIIEALGPVLAGRTGLMLEVGSGTGQHCVLLADAFPKLDWQPSDPFEVYLDSIRAWGALSGAPNLRDPIWLDAAEPWPDLGRLAGVLAANVIHITPWVVTKGIVRGAGAAPAGLLAFYGPFREGGQHTGDGNAAFDAQLRAMDAAWGVRNIDDVADLAAREGFGPPEIIPMPSNNRLVVFERA